MTQTVGFIGLGAIGWPMAQCIAGAFDTVVWNRTERRAKAFAKETGARAAASPSEVVADCGVIITCLPTSLEVLGVIDATRDAWREGQLMVDATSGDPKRARDAADRLTKVGAGFVDAPVSGGTGGAKEGTLTVMMGGDEPWISRAKEIVVPYAGKVVHVGPVGAGHAVKAVNQALLAVNIVGAGEGLAALVKLGVKAEIALEVINASSGRSNVTETLFPKRVVSRAWPRTFRLALLDKDVGNALAMLDDNGVHSGALRAAKEAVAKARRALGAEADHVELVKEIERAAGVEIR